MPYSLLNWLVLISSAVTLIQGQLTPCDSENKCLCTPNNLICSQFTSFDQLQFLAANPAFTSIFLDPLAPISLDSKFTLNGLRLANNSRIHLTKLKSLSLQANPFAQDPTMAKTLKLSDSSLDFYLNSEQLSSVCSLRSTLDLKVVPLFSSFTRIELTESVRYQGPLCPLVFSRGLIDELILSNLSGNV